MSDQKVVVRDSGIGICGALFVLFVGLKLTGNIDWSWWWVSSPLWLPVAVVLALSGLILAIAWPLAALLDRRDAKRVAARRAARAADTRTPSERFRDAERRTPPVN